MNMKGKALLAGCIALVMSSAALAEDIKIAVVGAMSGPVAQYGDQEFTGAEQAVADINAKGGIKGNKLQIVKYDDACDPKQAVAVANKVVNDGIKYVIGHLCSSSTQPASDIYEDEGILMITPAATAPELTARGYKLILRTTGLDSDQGPTAAKYILDKVKPQRIAVVHDKQQYGEGLARAVQDGLKKGGANVVFFDGITAGEKDFSTLVARLKKENIDFVYYGGYHPEMGQILRQARAAGLKTQFMGPEGVANVSLSNIAGESAEGLLVTKPKNYDQVPANKPIVDAIKAKKQDPSGAFVWTTYAALQSLQAGLNQSDDPAKCVVCGPQPRSLTDVSSRGFRVLTPFYNAKCWVKWGAPFPLQMRCLTPVALRLPGLQSPGSPAKRSAAGFFLGHAPLIGATA